MRDTNQLHPKLKLKLLQLLLLCEEKGLKIQITECLRTKEEQDALFAKGRTAPGAVVTNAPGSTYSSMHQWGVAADFCRADGRGAFDDSDGFFTKVGNIGMSIGLEWGGSWTSPVDKPHFQLPDWGSTPQRLRQLYGTPEKFFTTWPKEEVSNAKMWKATHSAYIRKKPDGEKAMYEDLTVALKKCCKKSMKGYAIFKKGNTFEEKKFVAGWIKIAKGAYFPEKVGGKTKATPFPNGV